MKELYEKDLEVIKNVMQFGLPEIMSFEGLLRVEISVMIQEDPPVWAVIGHGNSGEPCLFGFEEETDPVVPVVNPNTNIFTTTYNETTKRHPDPYDQSII